MSYIDQTQPQRTQRKTLGLKTLRDPVSAVVDHLGHNPAACIQSRLGLYCFSAFAFFSAAAFWAATVHGGTTPFSRA